jgi:hypothetical protein
MVCCVQEQVEDWKTLLASHNARPVLLRSDQAWGGRQLLSHAAHLLLRRRYWPRQEKSRLQAPGPPQAISFDDLFPSSSSSSSILKAGSLSDSLIPITLYMETS